MNNKAKKDKTKYSTQNPSPRLLQTLQNIMFNQSGTISYIFVTERIEFPSTHPKGKVVRIKTTTSSPINPHCFYKEIRGKRYKRSLQELLQLFDDTAHDMGASYFIVS